MNRIQNDVNFQVNMRGACNKRPAGLTRLGWDSINSPKMFLSGNRVHRDLECEQKVTFRGLDSKWAWVEQDENMWVNPNVFKPLSFVLTESDLKIARRGRNRWSWGMKTKRTAVRVEILRNWEIFYFWRSIALHCTAGTIRFMKPHQLNILSDEWISLQIWNTWIYSITCKWLL